MKKKPKALLVGWDAADWQIINPLLAQGKMPGLARLMNGAVWGNLVTLDPPISPMLWTSIATGKRPYKHGIHGFTELAPDGETVRPVRVTSRKCKAVWNVLNEKDFKTNVIGWWPSHPAEKLDGVCVSNFYGISPDEKKNDWPLFEGAVYPEKEAEVLADLRLHPKEITPEIMQNFFPFAEDLNSDSDPVLRSCMRILAHASSIHNAATHLLENTEWDFTAVYFDALDHFSHLGMKYHPPQLKGISDLDFKNYHYIVEAAYRFHDMMLDRMLDLVGEDCNVFLVSDHGFESSINRYLHLPDEPGAPALEHRPYGIFVAQGPDVLSGQVYGASLLNVTPTLLSIFALPTADDMDGEVLKSVVKQEVTSTIKSYELGDIQLSAHDKSSTIDKELLAQLEALGYIKPTTNAEERKVLLSENEYYLARSLADGGKLLEAIANMKFLVETFPQIKRYAHYYAVLLLQSGDFSELKLLTSALENNSFKQYLEGFTLLQENKPLLAAMAFEQISAKANHHVLSTVAQAWFQAGDVNKAKEFALKALQKNSDSSTNLLLLGDIARHNEQWEEALGYFFKSLHLLYYQPNTHEKIAQCFYWLNMFEEAAQSLEVVLRLNPLKVSAIEQLKEIYTERVVNETRLAELNQMQHDFAVVVSGFPRSGTSMMMRMLAAGGLPVLADNHREADTNNETGYFELVDVKNAASNQSFLAKSSGKAVKIVMPLLRLIHPVLPLKVIWMERDLGSILKSQHKMLGQKSEAESFTQYAQLSTEQGLMEKWLNQHPHVSYLKIKYDDAVLHPQKTAEKVARFIGANLEIEKMSNAVQANLKHF